MSDAIKIVVGGDLFPTPINYQLFSEGKTEEIFGKEICEIFNRADYSICNLEGCFTDENTAPKLKDGPNIRAPKESIKAIKGLGVNCVSLANNHATDYGLHGLQDTWSVLSEAGISFFGAGETSFLVSTHYAVLVKGKKFTLYGVAENVENVPGSHTPGVNIYDEYRICNEIRALKAQCDYLIILYHGGIENIHYNTVSIRTRFHRMADNGADIIISQHTHAIGEEEYYNNSYLLYGQGNFCFHFSKKIQEWVETGLLLEIDIVEDMIKIKKHIVRRNGPCVIYDKEQDLSDFYERSKCLKDGDTFEGEIKRLADEQLIVYLQAFRGDNIIDKVIRKLFSREKYIKYIRKQYKKEHILKILLALQCEEFREVSTQGMLILLEETQDLKQGDSHDR